MKFTAAEIANLLEGTVDGDDSVEVSSLSKIDESTHGSLTFLAILNTNNIFIQLTPLL